MALIDNEQQTMQQALVNALSTADRVDIQVGYFYFSGFELLANVLKDKKIRILVGKQIDPKVIPKMIAMQQKTNLPVDLDRFQKQDTYSSNLEKRHEYLEGFVRLFEESQTFDQPVSQSAYKIFEEKILDGSMEIKLTETDNQHGKMYLIHNSPQSSQGGDLPGTLFVGSSNFTYNGLVGQGELTHSSHEASEFAQGIAKFDAMWKSSSNIDVATQDSTKDFHEAIKKLWINLAPSPYLLYVRVLHELFAIEKKSDIATPAKITGESFVDLEYQLDAIHLGIDRLNQFGGVIIADVVGLGKSIIASAIAYNIAHKENLNVVIIAPPHLKQQWEEYSSYFHLPGTKIFTSGLIQDAYIWCTEHVSGPVLLILDEAHRYRNELTDDYMLLHKITRSNPQNKILVLTATPFNNDPKDVFALIKLFQTPGQSTIKSVDNLSLRFRELIERYKKLRNSIRKEDLSHDEVDAETQQIAQELRRLIEPVIIRRSRLDLKRITRYRNNLIKQNIEFAEVADPILLEYELGALFDLYTNTLSKITDKLDGFHGARYKPTTYIKDDKLQVFLEKFGETIDNSDLKTAQSNLASFMRKLLVMRFESSKKAFEITLQNMIASSEFILKWYEKGKVPIQKKGKIPDPETYIEDMGDDTENIISQDLPNITSNLNELILIDKDWLSREFELTLRHDIQLLKDIKQEWFYESTHENYDPKLDMLEAEINTLLKENPDRKVVIFSAYSDTVNYLAQELKNRGHNRLYSYTSSDSSPAAREILRTNFDAGIKQSLQVNDYDILIATDALSEGYNLHQAGVVFNYDIPYNPTRVIQRIGRINRINKKVYENLYIYNFFPTTNIGEPETHIKQISTLKMTLINAVIGSDVKTLTSEETLKTFTEDGDVAKLLTTQLKTAEASADAESWDAVYRDIYDQIPEDIVKKSLEIRPRSRVIRNSNNFKGAIAFGKKGNHSIFAIKALDSEPSIVGAEQVLPYFVSIENEQGIEADNNFNELFLIIRDKLFAKNKLPQIKGNRAEAINRLSILVESSPSARDYSKDLIRIIRDYDDLSEGQYKAIAKTVIEDINLAYEQIQEIVSQDEIKVILRRAEGLDSQSEMIVLSEELRS